MLLISSLAFPWNAHAQSFVFNPNEVISDSDFFRVADMNIADIEEFLRRKSSPLVSYRARDVDGAENRQPRLFIARRSIMESVPAYYWSSCKRTEPDREPSPSQYSYDWATGFGVCDSCSVSDPGLAKFKGFVNQVDKAAARKIEYITTPLRFRFRVGEAATVDGKTVIPANRATAILYNYTPHFRGNFNFWKLWVRYFERFYPDGTVAQVKGSNDIWLIQDGVRRKFETLGAFLSRYSLSKVVATEKESLEKYPLGPSIKFPQYSLLQSKKGAIFLLVDDFKYGIPSKAIFKKIGFNPEEVIRASKADLDSYPTAGLLTAPSDNPVTELVQDKKPAPSLRWSAASSTPSWKKRS